MRRDTGGGSGREKMRSDVDMRRLMGPWIISHVSPSTWIRAVAWTVGRDWSPGDESVELCGEAGTTQEWLEPGEAMPCF